MASSPFKSLISNLSPMRLLYHKIKGFLAAVFYRFPGEKMVVIGVTGTNGKTTTTNFITSILNHAGFKVGMTSSINFQIGDKKWSNISKQSTLSPFKLQKMLRQMVREGCKYAVIEVTSHALTQSRVLGINFDIGVFTNITPEHIDYHGSFDSYLHAKGLLFRKISKGKRKFGVSKVAVLNKDDKYYSYFDQFVTDKKLDFGMKNATVSASDVVKKPDGTHFLINVPNNSVPVSLSLPGEFNVANALAAAAVAIALEVPLEVIKQGLEDLRAVPGRFEHVDAGQAYNIIIDYAHTPESLENLFVMYKNLTSGRLFVVFGATGGGRDKGKRPVMGKIADENADFIIVTDDDPYEEDEWEIIDQIAAGISREEGDRFWRIPDRREAIRLALTMAQEGDTVVLAGKGCEEVMMLHGKRVEWSDRKVVESLLSREIEVEIGEKSESRDNVRL